MDLKLIKEKATSAEWKTLVVLATLAILGILDIATRGMIEQLGYKLSDFGIISLGSLYLFGAWPATIVSLINSFALLWGLFFFAKYSRLKKKYQKKS